MTWADSNYKHKKLVTIDKDKVAGDDTDFPVIVSITDTDLTGCLSNGYDIKFYNANEDTQLKHERESFDNSTGALLAWVKIPVLSSTSDTLFYMYYEYEDEDTDQADPENVWDANFMMVQHMTDVTDQTTADSTSNDNDGTKEDSDSPLGTTDGKIGDAQVFSGADNYIKMADSVTLNGGADGFAELKIDMWFNPSDFGNGTQHMYFHTDWSDGIQGNFNDGGAMSIHHFGLTDEAMYPDLSAYFSNGTWIHMSIVYNGATKKVYLNGVERATENATGDVSQYEGDFYIGRSLNMFKGTIDEFRISDDGRSPNYITTEHNTQDDPDSFMSWGDEEKPEVVAVKRGKIVYGVKPARFIGVGRIGS